MKRKYLVPFIILPMLFSCSGNDDFANVVPAQNESYTVVLSDSSVSLDKGDETEVSALFDDDASHKCYWYLSRYDVVTIDTSSDAEYSTICHITAKAAGDVYLTVVSGNSSDRCLISVAGGSGGGGGGGGGETGEVTAVTLDYPTKLVELVAGKAAPFELTATVTATGNVDRTVTWLVSDSTIATVTKLNEMKAQVTPIKAGYTIVTAKAGNKTATCQVTIQEHDDSGLSIMLNKKSLTLTEGEGEQLTATVTPAGTEVQWASNATSIASVDSHGYVTAYSKGTATITATISNGQITKSEQCTVVVKSQGGSEYSFSQAGHLYLHYKRDNHDYANWAVWMWQSYPDDLGGSFWGANKIPSKWTAMSDHWMTNAEVGTTGTPNDPFEDENGQIVDIDLTNPNIVCGKTGDPAPIVNWDKLDKKSKIGFLIVDQTALENEGMWVSDGGMNMYIRRLNELFPEGKESCLHIYCIEGAVSEYTTEGGQPAPSNPTIKDDTGDYRSKNDIADLEYDAFTKGVATSTSTTFLDERPGTGYQIFVPSFADGDGDGLGDLRGIINKLDYLEDLGIDVLWLTPIQESDSYHGYDVTDYYKIDPKFGTMEDYQELIFKAHQRGMKVLMDMVINHTSKNNVLFKKSERAEVDEEKGINYRDMYLWKYKGDKVLEWDGVTKPKDWGEKHPNENWVANYNEINVETAEDWYKDGTSDYYYFGKFGSGMAELNYSCQATRDYMTDMCKYWLSFGLDGFRLDAVKHIYLFSEIDPSMKNTYSGDKSTYDVSYRRYYNEQTEQWVENAKNDYSYVKSLNVNFWKQFAGTIKSAYPECFLVGENFDGWNERIAPFYEAIDSQFDFSTYYHLVEVTNDGSNIQAMGYDIQATINYNQTTGKRGNAINGAFTSNHDVARLLNHAAALGKGKNAQGDQYHHWEIGTGNNKEGKPKVSGAVATNNARWFAAMTILTPGVSWIYYSDELGMSGNVEDGTIDDHGNNVDRWYRQPMKWEDERVVTNYTFSGLRIEFDNYNKTVKNADQQRRDADNGEDNMYSLFRALCHVKQSPDYPTYGQIKNWWPEGGQNTAAFYISDGVRSVRVFINATGNSVNISSLNQGQYIGGSVGSSNSVIPPYGFTCVKA